MTTEPTPVHQTLQDLADLLDQMRMVLAAEKVALIRRDADALEAQCERKAALCESLAAPRFGHMLVAQIAELPDDARLECETAHTSLLEYARQVRDYNLVNGKILNRSQHAVQEILNILSGKSLDGLYGQNGHQSPGTDSSRQAIARA